MPYTQYGASGLSGNYQISNNNFAVAKWPRVASISGGDYKFNNFNLANDAQLTLNGAVRLYILGIFRLQGDCKFILSTGATVQVYLGQNSNFSIANSAKMNQNGSPANMAIYSASTNLINFAGTGDAQINGVIYAPAGRTTVANSTKFRGAIVSDQLRITGNARVYHDIALSELPVPGDPGGSGGSDPVVIRWTKPGWANRFQ